MVALYTVWYSFAKLYRNLMGITPAMAAGVPDKLWDRNIVLVLFVAVAPNSGKRGSCKKRNPSLWHKIVGTR